VIHRKLILEFISDLKSFQGPYISIENGLDSSFSVKTHVSGHLLVHLEMDGVVWRFPTFQKENQRNDYSVRQISSTVYIIKNGGVINKTESPVSKTIFVEFDSSDTLWTVFNRESGNKKHSYIYSLLIL
jgi:hypothetical protein